MSIAFIRQCLLDCLQDEARVCSACDAARLELSRLNRTLEEAKLQNLNQSGYRTLLQAVLTDIDGLRLQMEHRLRRTAGVHMNVVRPTMQTSSSACASTKIQPEGTTSYIQATKQNLVSIREAIRELRDELHDPSIQPVIQQQPSLNRSPRKPFRFDSSRSVCPLADLLASSEIGRHLLNLSDADEILSRFEHMELSFHDWQMLATDLIHAASVELSEASGIASIGPMHSCACPWAVPFRLKSECCVCLAGHESKPSSWWKMQWPTP